jgi:peptidoglycan/xylan/chitin deacetylase (PgdA/CDA1 family)
MRLLPSPQRLQAAGTRISARLWSRGLSLIRDFSALPIVISAHGLHEDSVPAGLFPRRNFMSVRALHDVITALDHDGYRFVSFDDIAHYLDGTGTLPPRAVHVLFDDGYRSVYEHALPVLARAGVPFSVALVETFVRGGRLLWPDELHCRIAGNLTQIPVVNRIAPRVLSITAFDAETCRINYQENRLKFVPNDERVRILTAIAEHCPLREPVDAHLLALEPRQIDELRASGVSILGHSRSHAMLSQIESDAELAREVENWDPTLLDRRAMVLPFGLPSETNPRVAGALRGAGYRFAFSMQPGYVAREAPSFGLHRISMQRGADAVRAQLATLAADHRRGLEAASGRVAHTQP